MSSRHIAVAPLIAMIALTGCASMSSEECASGDWVAVGYEDGSRGYSSDRFSAHRKACAKHGYTANFEAYQRGREQGLVEYCQPGRGFSVGASGGQYNGVCAADTEADFLHAYHAGRKLYRLRDEVYATGSQLDRAAAELDRVEDEIVDVEAAILNPRTTQDERILLLIELKDLAEHKGELEHEIESLHLEHANREAELRHYEDSIAAYGY